MAFDLTSIQRGPRSQPPRLLVYGPHGVGKTTFACAAPAPIVIQTEDGLGMLETPAFPLVTSTADVFEAMETLYNQDHEFKTVVLDSADWLDNLIAREVRSSHSIQELAYGKDTLLIAEQWRMVLDWLNALRSKHMTVILVGHAEIKRFDSPDSDSYERYQPKLTARASALVQEWADAVLFAGFKTFVKSEKVTEQKAVKKAVSGGERLLHTGEKPAHLAKNRYSLPETLPLSWNALAEAINTVPIPF